MRDKFKYAQNWPEYKKNRNKVRNLIRKAKKQLFTESITSQKDTKTLWKHFRSYTNKSSASQNSLPEELTMNAITYTESEDIAVKLNEYFASVCDQISTRDDFNGPLDLEKLKTFIESKVPPHVHFNVLSYINPNCL